MITREVATLLASLMQTRSSRSGGTNQGGTLPAPNGATTGMSSSDQLEQERTIVDVQVSPQAQQGDTSMQSASPVDTTDTPISFFTKRMRDTVAEVNQIARMATMQIGQQTKDPKVWPIYSRKPDERSPLQHSTDVSKDMLREYTFSTEALGVAPALASILQAKPEAISDEMKAALDGKPFRPGDWISQDSSSQEERLDKALSEPLGTRPTLLDWPVTVNGKDIQTVSLPIEHFLKLHRWATAFNKLAGELSSHDDGHHDAIEAHQVAKVLMGLDAITRDGPLDTTTDVYAQAMSLFREIWNPCEGNAFASCKEILHRGANLKQDLTQALDENYLMTEGRRPTPSAVSSNSSKRKSRGLAGIAGQTGSSVLQPPKFQQCDTARLDQVRRTVESLLESETALRIHNNTLTSICLRQMIRIRELHTELSVVSEQFATLAGQQHRVAQMSADYADMMVSHTATHTNLLAEHADLHRRLELLPTVLRKELLEADESLIQQYFARNASPRVVTDTQTGVLKVEWDKVHSDPERDTGPQNWADVQRRLDGVALKARTQSDRDVFSDAAMEAMSGVTREDIERTRQVPTPLEGKQITHLSVALDAMSRMGSQDGLPPSFNPSSRSTLMDALGRKLLLGQEGAVQLIAQLNSKGTLKKVPRLPLSDDELNNARALCVGANADFSELRREFDTMAYQTVPLVNPDDTDNLMATAIANSLAHSPRKRKSPEVDTRDTSRTAKKVTGTTQRGAASARVGNVQRGATSARVGTFAQAVANTAGSSSPARNNRNVPPGGASPIDGTTYHLLPYRAEQGFYPVVNSTNELPCSDVGNITRTFFRRLPQYAEAPTDIMNFPPGEEVDQLCRLAYRMANLPGKHLFRVPSEVSKAWASGKENASFHVPYLNVEGKQLGTFKEVIVNRDLPWFMIMPSLPTEIKQRGSQTIPSVYLTTGYDITQSSSQVKKERERSSFGFRPQRNSGPTAPWNYPNSYGVMIKHISSRARERMFLEVNPATVDRYINQHHVKLAFKRDNVIDMASQIVSKVKRSSLLGDGERLFSWVEKIYPNASSAMRCEKTSKSRSDLGPQPLGLAAKLLLAHRYLPDCPFPVARHMREIAANCSPDNIVREEYERINRQIHWESLTHEGPNAGQRATPKQGVKPNLKEMFPLPELLMNPSAPVEETAQRYNELGVATNAERARALIRTLRNIENEIEDLGQHSCYEVYALIGEGYQHAVRSLRAAVSYLEELRNTNASVSTDNRDTVDGASSPAELEQ